MSDLEFNTIMGAAFGLTALVLAVLLYIDRRKPAPINPITWDDEPHGEASLLGREKK